MAKVKAKANSTGKRKRGGKLGEALRYLGEAYPDLWSPTAVCHWLANHPAVHQLLVERLEAFQAIVSGSGPAKGE